VDIGGSLGRREATGRGVMFVVREYLHRMGIPMIGTRVAVQGFGNVGGTAALLLHHEGCKVVAVSDVSGGLHDPKGLDVAAIAAYLSERGRLLKDYAAPKGAKRITNAELLECDCDLLVPAALENQLTAENAGRIKARIVVEGANGPTTAEADAILERRGVKVVPDILANAGGVVVSYFEWVQNIQSLMWDEEEVNRTLEKIMIRAFNEVWAKTEKHATTMRMGAYMAALERITKAKRIRGVFP
jgi:glutamate dehydrogenase (NAD(P)+)